MMKQILLFCALLCSIKSFSQVTTVNSLAELSEYLDDDNVNVKLTPGTYTVTEGNASNYGGFETIGAKTVYTLFPVFSSNSIFDFTGVTLNVETPVFRAFGNVDIYELRIAGTNTVVKNLTLVDVGSVHDAPRKGVNNIVIDGKDNVVEGFDVNSTGSSPYGYGDIFGKGGGALVPLDKHSGILIRGDYNTLRNTTIFHRAFGHCVFMQAANHPTIEGCHIQGEVRTSDDMLTEEGTGTLGDQQGFITTWGYKLPPGFTLALCEAGIRSYNAGTTIVEGVTYERGSNDITVRNTTVKNTRSGCTISQASGSRVVENVTLIGNESGFALGNGIVINGFADAAYGPIYDGSNNVTGEVTLLEPENGYYNGSKCLASMSGGELTINTSEANIPADIFIELGGYRSLRHQPESSLLYQVDSTLSGAELYNHSGATVRLGGGANNNEVNTCGLVIDNGSGNTVNLWDECELAGGCNNKASLIEAECFDSMEEVDNEGENIGSIKDGSWSMYEGIDLTNMNSVRVTAASRFEGGTIELRLDGVEGELIGVVDVSMTGNWTIYEEFYANITRVDGVHDLYMVYKGEPTFLFNIDKSSFSEEVYCNNDVSHIEAECYDEMSGIQTQNCTEGTENVGWVNADDWIMLEDIDLTGYGYLEARVSGKTDGSTIEIRLDGVSGELIGELEVENTSGNQNWVTNSTRLASIAETRDVYFVFKGGTGFLFNLNYFSFIEDTELDIKVLLESCYDDVSGIMDNELGDLMSSVEPYEEMGYTIYQNREDNVVAEVKNREGIEKVIDWVLIELYDVDDLTLIESKSGLLLASGKIASNDGISPFSISRLVEEAYVVVRHRNHLAVMSKEPINLEEGNSTIDFSDIGYIYSDTTLSNAPAKEMANGVYALYQGDANRDGQINSNDASTVFANVVPVVSDVYDVYDLDLDGTLSTTDAIEAFKNAVPIVKSHVE